MADWFRRTTWSPEDQADFESRLARARATNRPQYLRIQAGHLAAIGLHEQAIVLLRRVVDDYPRSLDVAPALSQLSASLLATGAVTECLDALRRCMQREHEFPNARTDAWLDFAFTVARLRLAQFYSEAASTLELRLGSEGTPLFPIQRFKHHAARAMLLAARGEAGAADEAKRALDAAALETPGLRYHSALGLVGDSYADIERCLRGIVDEASFWSALEYRVSREMAGVEECRRRGMWCDGFVAQAVELDASPNRILGRAWVGLGRDQESWTFELWLPTSVASREEIRWSELLPAEDVTQWLSVDHEGKHLVIAPGDAEDDPA